jgi:protein TonB
MRRAALLAALLLVACGEPPSPAPEKPAAPAESAPPTPPPQALIPTLPPPRTPLDAYKRDIAQRILTANAAQTFEGRPPEILQAVVVLQFTIERSGTLTGLRTLRSRHPAQEKVAHSSVRAAAPFPAPPAGVLRSGRVEVAETWLFRDDGRFQIRSLAEPQASTE